MYLVKLDEETGLVIVDKNDDGVYAIKEFREIINNEKFGIRCFTAIALTADYQTPWRFYDDTDRPRKAQEEVTGNRDYWNWNLTEIQTCLRKYDDLQYDPTLEEGRIHYNQKIKKLKEIQEYDTLSSEEKAEKKKNGITVATLKKELRAINTDIDEYDKRIAGKDVYKDSPVKNGYKLSRLEQKLENKNSFYHQVR